MCGRFAIYSPSEVTAARFCASSATEVVPCYNNAPTQFIAAERSDLIEVIDNSPSFQAWPVDRKVNNARDEELALIEPAAAVIS